MHILPQEAPPWRRRHGTPKGQGQRSLVILLQAAPRMLRSRIRAGEQSGEAEPLVSIGVTYRGVCPEGTLGTVLTRGPWGSGVLAEVVVPINGGSAEVAHLGATAARHAVAAFGFDQAGGALVALSDAGRCHLLFSAMRQLGKG